MIDYSEFKKMDIRVGKIIDAESLQNDGYVTHKVVINFGTELGTKVSYASLKRYSQDELIGKMIAGIINLAPKKIGENISEVLLLGTPDKDNECILISPDSDHAIIGAKVY